MSCKIVAVKTSFPLACTTVYSATTACQHACAPARGPLWRTFCNNLDQAAAASPCKQHLEASSHRLLLHAVDGVAAVWRERPLAADAAAPACQHHGEADPTGFLPSADSCGRCCAALLRSGTSARCRRCCRCCRARTPHLSASWPPSLGPVDASSHSQIKGMQTKRFLEVYQELILPSDGREGKTSASRPRFFGPNTSIRSKDRVCVLKRP